MTSLETCKTSSVVHILSNIGCFQYSSLIGNNFRSIDCFLLDSASKTLDSFKLKNQFKYTTCKSDGYS